MSLCLHQNTSAGAGYRKSLEGWAKAGIKNVELTANSLDEFLKTDNLAAARRVVTDLGLTPVSCTPGLADLWNTNPNRMARLDSFKQRCEQFASFGLTHIYNPSGTNAKITKDDYKSGAQNMRDVGEIAAQYKMTAMIEFVRNSPYISNLTTLLMLTREAAHANIKPMLDCYHFWSWQGKFEDLDLLKPGELGHVHFQDVPDMPRELLDTTTRVPPGDGVTPLVAILKKLADKGYAGPLSVELLATKYTQADPFAVATEIKPKAEAVMKKAGVAS